MATTMYLHTSAWTQFTQCLHTSQKIEKLYQGVMKAVATDFFFTCTSSPSTHYEFHTMNLVFQEFSVHFIAILLRRCFVLLWAAQIGNMQTELKKLAELNPELKDAYLAKQRRLKVSKNKK